jgi:hypothetical protein
MDGCLCYVWCERVGMGSRKGREGKGSEGREGMDSSSITFAIYGSSAFSSCLYSSIFQHSMAWVGLGFALVSHGTTTPGSGDGLCGGMWHVISISIGIGVARV